MMRSLRLLLLLLPLLAATAPAKEDAETKGKEKIAKVWVDYARWLKMKGLKEEATGVLARARELDPGAKDLDRLTQEVEALPGDAADEAGLERRREQANRDVAKLYERLAKLDHKPEDAARFDDYLMRAVELDPSKARLAKLAGMVKQLAGNRANVDKAGRLLVRLRELDPEGKWDALEQDLARGDVALVKSAKHAMVGYLSLPKGWKKGGHYPVLVTVEGAGCSFLGRARGAAKTRGSRDVLVLAPCSLSNTNELDPAKYPWYTKEQLDEWNRDRITFDVEGLLALLDLLAERYGADERFAVTGFSGGGNLCYAMTALYPKRVLVSAPACANFSGLGFSKAAPVEGGGPPVRIMTGAEDPHKDFTFGRKDSPGIEPQTDRAVATLDQLGFKDVTRTMIKGAGHSPLSEQVWDHVDEALRGR